MSNNEKPNTYLQGWMCPQCNKYNSYKYKSWKLSKYMDFYDCEQCDYKHAGANLDIPNGFEIITRTGSSMDGWGREVEYSESVMIYQCPKCKNKQITTYLKNIPSCKSCGHKIRLSMEVL